MPVTPADLRTAEIVLKGTASAEGSDAQDIVNVFHFRRTTTTVPVNKINTQGAFVFNVLPSIVAALNVTYTATEVAIRMLEDVTDPYYVNTLASSNLGLVTGDRRKPSDSAFLLLKTPYRGRSYRGSKRFSPMSESDTTAGTADLWNAACLTRLHAIATAIMAGFTSAEGNVWVPCLWSRKQSDMTTVPATVQTFDLSQILVAKRIGSQKSRTVKGVY